MFCLIEQCRELAAELSCLSQTLTTLSDTAYDREILALSPGVFCHIISKF